MIDQRDKNKMLEQKREKEIKGTILVRPKSKKNNVR